MTRFVFFLAIASFIHTSTGAQSVAINTDGTTASASSILDVKSTEKGFLTPRMTTAQRNAIVNPERGLLVFDTDKGTFFFYDGTAWRGMGFLNSNNVPPVVRTGSELEENGQFGASVAVYGNYMAVSRLSADAPGVSNCGAVYIFAKEASGNWIEQTKIIAPDAAQNDRFGYALDMDGDYLIVGAPEKSIGGNYSQGKAYIFKRQNDNWLYQVSLIRAGGQSGERHGFDVSITATSAFGVLAAVSSPYFDNGAQQDRGIVQLYRRDPLSQVWSSSTLVPGNLAAGDCYGFSLDADGDEIVIGAPYHEVGALSNAGIAYLYHYNGSSWISEGDVQYNHAGMGVGFSVSISNGFVAIGAPLAVYNSIQSGSVFIKEREAGVWHSRDLLQLPSDYANIDRLFGADISLSNNRLIISAPAGNLLSGGGEAYLSYVPGMAFIYTKNINQSTFLRVHEVTAAPPVDADMFGQALSIQGNTYVIGNHKSTQQGMQNAGAFYIGNIE